MFSNQRFLHLSTFSLLTSHYGWIITPNLSDRPIADTPLAARMRLLQPAGNTHNRIQALLLSACTSRDITASISPSCSKQTRRLMQFQPPRTHERKNTAVEIQNTANNEILEKAQVGLPHVLCEGGLEVGEDWVFQNQLKNHIDLRQNLSDFYPRVSGRPTAAFWAIARPKSIGLPKAEDGHRSKKNTAGCACLP